VRLCMRALVLASLAVNAAVVPCRAQGAGTVQPLLLFDFESEEQTDAFATSDSAREANPDAWPLVRVFQSRVVPPDVPGECSLHVMFSDGQDAWARVSTPVNCSEWMAQGRNALSLWVSSYVAQGSVDLALITDQDKTYVASIELPSEGWTKVTVPLRRFKADDGASAVDDLAGIRTMAIEKRGTWQGCVLRVDQVALVKADIEESTAPPPGGETTTTTEGPGTGPEQPGTGPTTEGPTTAAHSVSVNAAFGATEGLYFMAHWGVNAVLGEDDALLSDPKVASFVRALQPIIRVVVSIPTDPAGDEALFRRLDPFVATCKQVARERGVLISIGAPVDGTVEPKRYQDLCLALVKRYNLGPGGKPSGSGIRYWELLQDPLFLQDGDYKTACQLFNSASKAMRAADPDVRVGGMSFFAAQWAPMERVIRGTSGLLSFLSWHVYGAPMLSATDQQLMDAADSGFMYGVSEAIGATKVLDVLKAGAPDALLFVTECNMNRARTADGQCPDPRAGTSFASAWLASYFITASAVVDVVLLSRTTGASWGMVGPNGTAGPVYWTARLLQEHLPRGSTSLVAKAVSSEPKRLRAVAGLIGDKRVVLLVNRSDQPVAVHLEADGLPRTYGATVFAVSPTGDGIVQEDLSPTRTPAAAATAGGVPAQRLALDAVPLGPYGVAVVEFAAGVG